MTTATACDAQTLMAVTLRVNGREHALSLDPRESLLDALRDHLGLTGSQKGCERGHCGACTVLVDGRRIYSCLALAVAHDRAHVTTVEHLTQDAAAALLNNGVGERRIRHLSRPSHPTVMLAIRPLDAVSEQI